MTVNLRSCADRRPPSQAPLRRQAAHPVVHRLAVVVWLACSALLASTPAQAQQPPPATPPPPPVVEPFVRHWTRAEVWRFFTPPVTATAGDPEYAFVGNRLQAGLRLRRGVVDATLALQYVQLGGLPDDAIGPGALGTGALYFDHSGDTTSSQVFLKAAHIAFRKIGGAVDVQIGRMPYAGGAERASGVPKIEAVKRQRIDARLLGEFEWSLFQRGFDGVRVDWAGQSVQATGAVFRPTQGGYEEAAGVSISGIDLFSGVVTTAPGRVVPHTESQVFLYRYNDDRLVTARPDNSGRRASAVDVGVTTIGGHLISARPAASGELDLLLWTAFQTGHWYEQDHRALALVTEGGFQWPKATWAPWVRGGYSWLAGDTDATDEKHGTFFPMLPTGRRYSLSTLYALANLRDASLQLMLRPRANLTGRLDAHFLSLATAADGWYAGSGATQERGRIFGYTLRPSRGATRLMTVVEGSLDWRYNRHWSVNGYLGVAAPGPVVRSTFLDRNATFFYLENAIQFP